MKRCDRPDPLAWLDSLLPPDSPTALIEDADRCCSTVEAAAALGRQVETVRKWCSAGVCKARKSVNTWFLTVKEIMRIRVEGLLPPISKW